VIAESELHRCESREFFMERLHRAKLGHGDLSFRIVPKLREAATIKSPKMLINAGREFIGAISAIIGGRISSGLPLP